jgi:hypothetical protein
MILNTAFLILFLYAVCHAHNLRTSPFKQLSIRGGLCAYLPQQAGRRPEGWQPHHHPRAARRQHPWRQLLHTMFG